MYHKPCVRCVTHVNIHDIHVHADTLAVDSL